MSHLESVPNEMKSVAGLWSAVKSHIRNTHAHAPILFDL